MTIKTPLAPVFLLASVCGAAQAQTPDKGNVAFQYFVTDDKLATSMNVKIETMSGKIVTGSPFSASEERHTLQVLGDGTRIDKKESDKYFRDSDGRTRTERNNGETVIVSDPVSGVTSEISTANKTARKIMVRHSGPVNIGSPADGAMMDKHKAEAMAGKSIARSTVVTAEAPVIGAFSTTDSRGFTFSAAAGHTLGADMNVPSEDLGTQVINGVPAKGTRSTVTIPEGQIGNDREIKIVSERWFSDDLQMLIKSSNKDPRFGETTYELTNILRGAQDPTLFQIPSDFKVNAR